MKALESKVRHGERLSFADAVALYKTPDLAALGALANHVREKRHGNKTTYIVNSHLNYSNLCTLACKFCAFARAKGRPGGYEMTPAEILAKADRAASIGASELHIVGGLHPDWPYSAYPEMLRALKARHPQMHLKAFTAVEIRYFAGLSGKSIAWVLEDLRAAGLGSLPGGGAEIFAERVRKEICGPKDTRTVAGGPSHRPRDGDPLHGHDALRAHRNRGGSRGSPDAVARPPGRDEGVHGAHPAFLPSGRDPNPRPASVRLRRPEEPGGLAPGSRQLRPHQGLLDPDRAQTGPTRTLLRGRRHRRHRGRGDHHPYGRGQEPQGRHRTIPPGSHPSRRTHSRAARHLAPGPGTGSLADKPANMPHTIIDTCIGCTACKRSAPPRRSGSTRASKIVPDASTAGLQLGLPADAIFATTTPLAPAETRAPGRDLRALHRREYCVHVCPRCLSIEGEPPTPASGICEINPRRGCGLCVAVCDKDAIVVFDKEGKTLDHSFLKLNPAGYSPTQDARL